MGDRKKQIEEGRGRGKTEEGREEKGKR